MTISQDAVAGLVKRITSNAAFLERKGWSKSAVLEREAATALEQQAATIVALENALADARVLLLRVPTRIDVSPEWHDDRRKWEAALSAKEQ